MSCELRAASCMQRACLPLAQISLRGDTSIGVGPFLLLAVWLSIPPTCAPRPVVAAGAVIQTQLSAHIRDRVAWRRMAL